MHKPSSTPGTVQYACAMSDGGDDWERAHRIGRPIGRFMERWRTVIRKRPWLNIVYKTLITIIGVAVVIIGVILIPLPGPGWLIVFIGMTILGSEYHWARRFTSWLRMMLARFWYWWRAWRRRRRTRKVAKQRAKRVAREGL